MRWLTSSGSSMGPRLRKVIDPVAGAVLVVLAVPVPAALGHYETPMAPQSLWGAWNWEPMVLLSLALAAWIYGRGVSALWRRAGAHDLRSGQLRGKTKAGTGAAGRGCR